MELTIWIEWIIENQKVVNNEGEREWEALRKQVTYIKGSGKLSNDKNISTSRHASSCLGGDLVKNHFVIIFECEHGGIL